MGNADYFLGALGSQNPPKQHFKKFGVDDRRRNVRYANRKIAQKSSRPKNLAAKSLDFSAKSFSAKKFSAAKFSAKMLFCRNFSARPSENCPSKRAQCVLREVINSVF